MTPIRHRREGGWDRVKQSGPLVAGILVGLAVTLGGAILLQGAPHA